jgi:hypothetical protein
MPDDDKGKRRPLHSFTNFEVSNIGSHVFNMPADMDADVHASNFSARNNGGDMVHI